MSIWQGRVKRQYVLPAVFLLLGGLYLLGAQIGLWKQGTQLGQTIDQESLAVDVTDLADKKTNVLSPSDFGTGGVEATIKQNLSKKFSAGERRNSDTYFGKLLQDKKLAELYRRSKKIMGSSAAGDGAARWVTLGVLFVSNREFSDTLTLAQQEMNSDPGAVLNRITQNIETIRRDPFIYQMVGNLIYHMNVGKDEKARIYAEELKHQIENLRGEPSNSFWVAVNNLTLYKQSGAGPESLQRALNSLSGNSGASVQIIEEIKTAARGFYPEIEIN